MNLDFHYPKIGTVTYRDIPFKEYLEYSQLDGEAKIRYFSDNILVKITDNDGNDVPADKVGTT